ncbi:MAG: transcriptional repressor [Deltaproteobacteria bacterium]|nr:transcriptional repressor [Deltaproteobacteria bacterium]
MPSPTTKGKQPGGTVSGQHRTTGQGREERLLFVRFLESKRLKLTRQREAVINAIFTNPGHFEAEELVARLQKGDHRASRATVYRTLELMKECQLVEKLDFGTPQSYYEQVTPGQHHDHLICTGCGQITEFHDESLESAQHKATARHGFEETHHSLRIFGICARCGGR